jgi:hypothetical protein
MKPFVKTTVLAFFSLVLLTSLGKAQPQLPDTSTLTPSISVCNQYAMDADPATLANLPYNSLIRRIRFMTGCTSMLAANTDVMSLSKYGVYATSATLYENAALNRAQNYITRHGDTDLFLAEDAKGLR